jgi:hypothetical protein
MSQFIRKARVVLCGRGSHNAGSTRSCPPRVFSWLAKSNSKSHLIPHHGFTFPRCSHFNSNSPIVKCENVHHTKHPMVFVLEYHWEFLGESLELYWNDFRAARCRCLLHFHSGPGTPAQVTEGHKVLGRWWRSP